MPPPSVALRAMAAVSRRLGRPELLATFNAEARRNLREEVAEHVVLATCLRRGACFIDVGANEGQWLGGVMRVAPEGRHVAFEPVPQTFRILRERFPRVDCRQMALSDAPGEADFVVFDGMTGWSGFRPRPQVADRTDARTIRVKVSTIDQQIADIVPAVIKIDVEGNELAVLRGAEQTIRRHRPVLIFEHTVDPSDEHGTPDSVWSLIDGHGYRLFTLQGHGPMTFTDFASDLRTLNWLALPA